MRNDFKIKNINFCCKRGTLSQGNKQQVLSFTETKLLELLLNEVNEIVLKETLKEFAWQHTVVTDSSLTKSIAKLRKALAFFLEDEELIITIPRVGYKLVSNDVTPIAEMNNVTDLEECLATEDSLIQATESTSEQPSTMSLRNKILFVLSVLLIGGALFNFLRFLPSDNERYIDDSYHLTELSSNGFTHKVITPKSMELPQEISYLLSQQKCDCLFFVDKISDHFNISYFDPEKSQGVSLILDEKSLAEKLGSNLPQGDK
ncbi:winged helix-turn-helix domain-containing protein [Photobacterium leiognathi]|uniref:winged helix-turn-helix domain-containing protein n=1 Tax=Photobacterium leiognathi TaxID=553611 RepID=UPI0029824A0D|nr:winged helix-turn-helix domain-containing protein [Photobacterium leiognathi]